MARSILDIPPELLIHILSFLPVQALLRFSQICRSSHSVAKSSLHTLALGIHATRVSSIISRVGATQYPRSSKIRSAFTLPDQPKPLLRNARNFATGYIEREVDYEGELDENDPYKVSMVIPDAHALHQDHLLQFHTILTASILSRHSGTLRNLDLSIWTLSIPIAEALSQLPALRALSIRIDDFSHVRTVSRKRAAAQRVEQRDAWELLTNKAVWAPRLHAFRVESGELTSQQLSNLLRRNRWCRELWLSKCRMVDKGLWDFLGTEWEGRTALRILGVMSCGGQLDEDVLDLIDSLTGLEVSPPSVVSFLIRRRFADYGSSSRSMVVAGCKVKL